MNQLIFQWDLQMMVYYIHFQLEKIYSRQTKIVNYKTIISSTVDAPPGIILILLQVY